MLVCYDKSFSNSASDYNKPIKQKMSSPIVEIICGRPIKRRKRWQQIRLQQKPWLG